MEDNRIFIKKVRVEKNLELCLFTKDTIFSFIDLRFKSLFGR